MVQAARLIGPTVAGLLVASVGTGVCFVLNSASYLAIVVAIVAMRLGPSSHMMQRRHVLHELQEGFHLRLRLRANQEHPTPGRLDEPYGDAICGAGSCLRKKNPPRFSTHLRLSHDGWMQGSNLNRHHARTARELSDSANI